MHGIVIAGMRNNCLKKKNALSQEPRSLSLALALSIHNKQQSQAKMLKHAAGDCSADGAVAARQAKKRDRAAERQCVHCRFSFLRKKK